MKVSTKLYGTLGTLAGIGILVAGAGIWYVRTLGEELTVATSKTAVKLDLINATRARAWEMVAALRGAFVHSNLNEPVELEASAGRWSAASQRTHQQLAEIRPLLVTAEGRRLLDRFESGLGEFEKLSAEYIQFCRAHQTERVTEFVAGVRTFTLLTDETLNGLKDQQRAILKDSQARAEALRSQSLFVNLMLSCFLLVGVLLAALIVRSINRTLRSAIAELSLGADQVSSAASQVSSSSQSLAQGSSEHAASLEETSASTEEINSMARRNTEHSASVATLVNASGEKFVIANQALQQTVAAMGEINSHSGKIFAIIKTIDEIAFQTNILALNAAVEAARAGEAGMGFAVVADEVRNLAQRCAQAARDTSSLIEESIAKSANGKTRVDQVAAAILTITGESVKVKSLVEEVHLGSNEQARGIEQIGRAITQMEQITQNTAASAEEGAAAAEELSAQSEAMKSVVERLTLMFGT